MFIARRTLQVIETALSMISSWF